MRECCCQDGVLAEHRTAVTASFSGGASSNWDAAGDATASETAEQPPVDGAASSSGDAADPAAAEPQGIAQQSDGATAPGRKAPDAGQPAQSAGAAAAEEEQVQDIGPFEPEAIVGALAGEDSEHQAQVSLVHQGSSASQPCMFSERSTTPALMCSCWPPCR